MSILENAEGVSVYDGTFNSAKKMVFNNYVNAGPSFTVLMENVSTRALHDAAERFDAPRCHPNTRVALLQSIDRWAQEGSQNGVQPVLWLNGPAGSGKSAIAQTLTEKWSKQGLLAASFFFRRRYPGCNSTTKFIPTLAYQLSMAVPSTRKYVERAVAGDMGIFKKNLERQMKELIVNPLLHALRDGPIPATVIVIDGLDECWLHLPHATYEEQQQAILEAIALTSSYDLPLKFFIASRPDHQIRQCFAERPLVVLARQITLNQDMNPDADIELYLWCKFDEIKQRHSFLRGVQWPPSEVIAHLVEMSSGHFVYPATVVRYVGAPRTDPRERLQTILGVGQSRQSSEGEQSPGPFAELDALYRHILHSVAPGSRRVVWDVLECLCYDIGSGAGAFPGLVDLSPTFIEKLQFIPHGQIYVHLTDLHSILDIPPPEHADKHPIQSIHASFADFLSDGARSGDCQADFDRAALSHYLNWFKHLLVLSSTDKPLSGYDAVEIRNAVTLRLSGLCPPSKALKEGFEAVMGSDDRTYHSYLERVGLGYLHARQRLVLPGPLADTQFREILLYLQKCNIKAFEVSWIKRWRKDRRLRTMIRKLDGHGGWAAPLDRILNALDPVGLPGLTIPVAWALGAILFPLILFFLCAGV